MSLSASTFAAARTTHYLRLTIYYLEKAQPGGLSATKAALAEKKVAVNFGAEWPLARRADRLRALALLGAGAARPTAAAGAFKLSVPPKTAVAYRLARKS